MRIRLVPLVVAGAAATLSACTSSGGAKHPAGSFEARPVIMPAQHATGARPDAFGSLHPPADEAAYSALSRARQAALTNALRGVDCAHPPSLPGSALRVACDAQSYAYLLGAPLFTGHDVTSATPIAPAANSSTQWQISLSIKSAGADKAYAWTSRYHVDAPDGVYTVTQTSSKPPCGADARTACSDFLAYVSDDVVVSVPLTVLPVRSAVLVSGDFTEESATQLARKITG